MREILLVLSENDSDRLRELMSDLEAERAARRDQERPRRRRRAITWLIVSLFVLTTLAALWIAWHEYEP